MACHAGRYFPGCRCCVSRLLFVFFFCILLPVVIYYRSWRRCLIASSASLIVLYLWKAYVVFVFCHWACEFDSLTACHLVCTLSGTTSKTCTTWIPSSSNPSKSSTTGPGWAGRGTVFLRYFKMFATLTVQPVVPLCRVVLKFPCKRIFASFLLCFAALGSR